MIANNLTYQECTVMKDKTTEKKDIGISERSSELLGGYQDLFY